MNQREYVLPLDDFLNLSEKELEVIQRSLGSLIVEDVLDLKTIRYVAGVDVSYGKRQAMVGLASYDVQEDKIHYSQCKKISDFGNYKSGYFSMRELPCVVPLWNNLPNNIRRQIDIVMVNGHGIAHPRGCGLASHLAFYLNKPTIGVAKSSFYGKYIVPEENMGASTPLVDEGDPNEQIGLVLRPKMGLKPIYISIGNYITLEVACDLVVKILKRYSHRLPHPLWVADRLSRSPNTSY